MNEVYLVRQAGLTQLGGVESPKQKKGNSPRIALVDSGLKIKGTTKLLLGLQEALIANKETLRFQEKLSSIGFSRKASKSAF